MIRASTGAELNTETDCELKEVHMLMVADGKSRESPATGPLEFAHGDEELSLTPTAFVYIHKSTSSFVFILNGRPVCNEAKKKTLTAQ